MVRPTPITCQPSEAELEADYWVQESLDRAITLLLAPIKTKLDFRLTVQ